MVVNLTLSLMKDLDVEDCDKRTKIYKRSSDWKA